SLASAKWLWALYVASTCAFSFVSSKILMVPIALIDSRIGLVQVLVDDASWSSYRAFIVIGSVLLSPLALMAASKTIPQDDVPFTTLIRILGGLVFLVSIAALIYFPHDMTPDKYINWRSSVFHIGRNSIIFFHF